MKPAPIGAGFFFKDLILKYFLRRATFVSQSCSFM